MYNLTVRLRLHGHQPTIAHISSSYLGLKNEEDEGTSLNLTSPFVTKIAKSLIIYAL